MSGSPGGGAASDPSPAAPASGRQGREAAGSDAQPASGSRSEPVATEAAFAASGMQAEDVNAVQREHDFDDPANWTGPPTV